MRRISIVWDLETCPLVCHDPLEIVCRLRNEAYILAQSLQVSGTPAATTSAPGAPPPPSILSAPPLPPPYGAHIVNFVAFVPSLAPTSNIAGSKPKGGPLQAAGSTVMDAKLAILEENGVECVVVHQVTAKPVLDFAMRMRILQVCVEEPPTTPDGLLFVSNRPLGEILEAATAQRNIRVKCISHFEWRKLLSFEAALSTASSLSQAWKRSAVPVGFQRPVGVFWDVENIWRPKPLTILLDIEAEFGPIAGVVGAVVSAQHASRVESAFSTLPWKATLAKKQADGPARKDAADEALVLHMFQFCKQHPPPAVVCLVSNDQDFIRPLSFLVHRGFHVVRIICPQHGWSETAWRVVDYVHEYRVLDRIRTAGPLDDATVASRELSIKVSPLGVSAGAPGSPVDEPSTPLQFSRLPTPVMRTSTSGASDRSTAPQVGIRQELVDAYLARLVQLIRSTVAPTYDGPDGSAVWRIAKRKLANLWIAKNMPHNESLFDQLLTSGRGTLFALESQGDVIVVTDPPVAKADEGTPSIVQPQAVSAISPSVVHQIPKPPPPAGVEAVRPYLAPPSTATPPSTAAAVAATPASTTAATSGADSNWAPLFIQCLQWHVKWKVLAQRTFDELVAVYPKSVRASKIMDILRQGYSWASDTDMGQAIAHVMSETYSDSYKRSLLGDVELRLPAAHYQLWETRNDPAQQQGASAPAAAPHLPNNDVPTVACAAAPDSHATLVAPVATLPVCKYSPSQQFKKLNQQKLLEIAVACARQYQASHFVQDFAVSQLFGLVWKEVTNQGFALPMDTSRKSYVKAVLHTGSSSSFWKVAIPAGMKNGAERLYLSPLVFPMFAPPPQHSAPPASPSLAAAAALSADCPIAVDSAQSTLQHDAVDVCTSDGAAAERAPVNPQHMDTLKEIVRNLCEGNDGECPVDAAREALFRSLDLPADDEVYHALLEEGTCVGLWALLGEPPNVTVAWLQESDVRNTL